MQLQPLSAISQLIKSAPWQRFLVASATAFWCDRQAAAPRCAPTSAPPHRACASPADHTEQPCLPNHSWVCSTRLSAKERRSAAVRASGAHSPSALRCAGPCGACSAEPHCTNFRPPAALAPPSLSSNSNTFVAASQKGGRLCADFCL